MSEDDQKSPQQPSKIWMIDEPTPFASKAEWEEFLESMTRLNERKPHPQLRRAIARAEAALKGVPVY